MSYEPRSPDELLFAPSSNGLAAGPSLKNAILRATFEVLERDAFLITWYNRLRGQRVDPLLHADGAVVDLCKAYRRRGVQIEAYRLSTDHPCHVFVALSIQEDPEDGPAAVVGLGAEVDPTIALRRAILEVGQVRPALRIRMRDPSNQKRLAELVQDPHRVSTLPDHDLLYASTQMLSAFDFLRSFGPGEPVSRTNAPTDSEKLDLIVNHFRSDGGDILYCNLTPPDMAALGLYTARVLLPGFQPIDFGWSERRLGGRRLFDLPVRLNLATGPSSASSLNSLPHPVA
jgi:ribosomal protein S12 methylthiotransferase accessory factor